MDDSPATSLSGIRLDEGLACLVLLLAFHQLPADAAQLRHALGKSEPANASDLVRLARRLGARARLGRSSATRIARSPLPAIGVGHDGGFFIIAGIWDGQALIQPAIGPPETLADLADRWSSGELILITTRAEAGVVGAFDVTWFIPALVKYRLLLGEVLAASLVIQLFALATPLIFQVVIDKVLVHKVLSTLDVLAIGLVAVMVFDIEERGANLSGGQRQRLAIARALITDPRILILDEATSALDAESESLIQSNMREIARGRTVLIIAHRLSALRLATRIVTVEAGAVVEAGTHESLVAAGGRYAQL